MELSQIPSLIKVGFFFFEHHTISSIQNSSMIQSSYADSQYNLLVYLYSSNVMGAKFESRTTQIFESRL